MIRQFFNAAVIMAAMLASAAHGQPMPTIVQVPGPNEELQAVAADFSTAEGIQPLLAAIARWLAANFDLPLILEPPRIVFELAFCDRRTGFQGATVRSVFTCRHFRFRFHAGAPRRYRRSL